MEGRKRREAQEEFRLSNFELTGPLGAGTFSDVKLVLHTPTQRPYALKCMRKGKLIHFSQLQHVVHEKRVRGHAWLRVACCGCSCVASTFAVLCLPRPLCTLYVVCCVLHVACSEYPVRRSTPQVL